MKKKEQTTVVFSGKAQKHLEELTKELDAPTESIVAEALDYYRVISQQYQLGRKACFLEGRTVHMLSYFGILGKYGEKWYQRRVNEKLN